MKKVSDGLFSTPLTVVSNKTKCCLWAYIAIASAIIKFKSISGNT